MSVESVVHKLIDVVHGGTGNAHIALELHQEVDEPSTPPAVPDSEKEAE